MSERLREGESERMREKEGREKLGLNSSHKSHLRNEACVRLVGEEGRERERLKLEEVEML